MTLKKNVTTALNQYRFLGGVSMQYFRGMFFVLVFTTASLAYADLVVHPNNPHYLAEVDSQGNVVKPILIIGGNKTLSPAADPTRSSGDLVRDRIDAWAADGVNYARVWTVLPWIADNPSIRFPWARSGTAGARVGGNYFDLNSFDATYWSELTSMIQYAESKGVMVQLQVFDEVGFESGGDRWDKHPLNPANHLSLNATSVLPSGTGASGTGTIYDTSNTELMNLLQAYVQKMVQSTCGYTNVIYEIANETTANWTWQKKWIDYIRSYVDNPSNSCRSRVISNNPFANQTENLNEANLTIVNYHNLSPGSVNSQFNSHYSYNKALNYDEQFIGTISSGDLINIAWEAVTGGGHFHWDETNNGPGAEVASRWLAKFFNTTSVNFVAMQPSNNLVDRGYALADAGEEYLIYLPSGGDVQLNLSALAGAASVQWYDPNSGNYASATSTNGGTTVSLSSPYGGSASVLYVKRSGPAIGIPDVPSGFSIQQSVN